MFAFVFGVVIALGLAAAFAAGAWCGWHFRREVDHRQRYYYRRGVASKSSSALLLSADPENDGHERSAAERFGDTIAGLAGRGVTP